MAPSKLVVFGDSVNWGQGLLTPHKFSTLVKKSLATQGLNLDVQMVAHSGATIGVRGPTDLTTIATEEVMLIDALRSSSRRPRHVANHVVAHTTRNRPKPVVVSSRRNDPASDPRTCSDMITPIMKLVVRNVARLHARGSVVRAARCMSSAESRKPTPNTGHGRDRGQSTSRQTAQPPSLHTAR